MSEKLTLSDVDKKAEGLYREYKDAYWEKTHNRQMLETPITAESLTEYNSKLLLESKKAYLKRMGKAAEGFTASYTNAAVKAEEAIDRNLAHAKTFAHDNADQLQEAAHIQAYMDGVETTIRHS